MDFVGDLVDESKVSINSSTTSLQKAMLLILPCKSVS